jgi:threonine dehydrogenase-like Zn-dependent dehydrogenase
VAVYGGGAVGLLAIQAARAMGAGHVTLVEPVASRRALGARRGADEALDPADLGPEESDLGFDVVVECSGALTAVLGGIRSARRAGRIALVGINRVGPLLDTWNVVVQEKEIVGSSSHIRDQDFAGALGMLSSGVVAYEDLLTRIPLSDSFELGLLALAERPEEFVKIVVVPDSV